MLWSLLSLLVFLFTQDSGYAVSQADSEHQIEWVSKRLTKLQDDGVEWVAQAMYHFSLGKKTWKEAQDFCQSYEAELTSILNAQEYNFINNNLQCHDYCWIGGESKGKNNTFTWTDGSPFTYINWSPAEPMNETADRNCLTLAPDHGYVPDHCTVKHYFVCKSAEDF
ncbi:hypothetical protein L596_009840 [Steinernema carpocapsae]|uniref:C-type lectin domain-containing protein n=1 Tax=Steinernema carpocapsae TaxID=34508 RepID=A0A4U5PGU2_STECR|nr:hypothetical protein L596_009840 [Steinernema carpocapsae]